MKKKIVNLMLLAATMVAASGAFVSCKDYCEDDINELKGQLADQNASLTNLINNQKTELQNQITALQTAQTQCAQNCEAIKTSLDNYLKKVDAENTYVTLERYNSEYLNYVAADALLEQAINSAKAALEARDAQQSDSIKTLAEQFMTLNGTVIEVSAKAQQALELAQKAKALAESDSIRIDGLNTSLTNLQTTVNNLNIISWTDNEFTTVKAAAESALANAAANKVIIDILRDSMNTVNQALQQLDGNFIEKVNKQGEDITALYTQVSEAKTYAETLNTTATAAIAANATTIGELKSSLSESEDAMKSDLKKVNAKIDQLTQALTSYVDDLFARYISGVIIQGTYNPVFGECAIPVGARSQVLAMFYGEAPSQGIEFPTVRGRYYVNQDDINLTEEDLERIGVTDIYSAEAGQILMNESKGNAGTLYFTVNPTSANLSQASFSLVNSLDEAAPVSFEEAVASEHKLGFGWTRSADNGFWEVPVTIALDDVKKFTPTLYLNADSADIVEKMKEVKNSFGRRSAADLAAAVFAVSGNVLDAYGMKTTWYDVNGKHSVLSSYSLAIASFKPLSYAFQKDANYQTVPGYERLIDQIEGMESLHGTKTRDEARSIIIEFVDKMNKYICDRVNDFNDYLQPTLLATYNNKVFRVTTKSQGSDVKGSKITLYPTSYSGEFLAPAFKKFVAVSNIYKNGESVGDEAVKAFNAANNLQYVMPGKATTVELEGLESGCVYEVVYSALDYSGKVVANKYYLNVQ